MPQGLTPTQRRLLAEVRCGGFLQISQVDEFPPLLVRLHTTTANGIDRTEEGLTVRDVLTLYERNFVIRDPDFPSEAGEFPDCGIYVASASF